MSEAKMTFKIGDKKIESDGKVSLTMHFSSVAEMMRYVSGNMGVPIRPEDMLDRAEDGRRFVLDCGIPDEMRLRAFVTEEVEL